MVTTVADVGVMLIDTGGKVGAALVAAEAPPHPVIETRPAKLRIAHRNQRDRLNMNVSAFVFLLLIFKSSRDESAMTSRTGFITVLSHSHYPAKASCSTFAWQRHPGPSLYRASTGLWPTRTIDLQKLKKKVAGRFHIST